MLISEIFVVFETYALTMLSYSLHLKNYLPLFITFFGETIGNIKIFFIYHLLIIINIVIQQRSLETIKKICVSY